MFHAVVLLACLALCHSHAVVPYAPVVPAVHALHTAPLVVPYLDYHGYAAHGLYGHGLLAKPLAHHILKRSPHYVAPLAPYTHVAPIAHVAPVAVSHQSRLDVHTSPAVVAAPVLPVVKPVVTPLVHAPLFHKSLVSPFYGDGLHGLGYYGGLYPNLAHGSY